MPDQNPNQPTQIGNDELTIAPQVTPEPQITPEPQVTPEPQIAPEPQITPEPPIAAPAEAVVTVKSPASGLSKWIVPATIAIGVIVIAYITYVIIAGSGTPENSQAELTLPPSIPEIEFETNMEPEEAIIPVEEELFPPSFDFETEPEEELFPPSFDFETEPEEVQAPSRVSR